MGYKCIRSFIYLGVIVLKQYVAAKRSVPQYSSASGSGLIYSSIVNRPRSAMAWACVCGQERREASSTEKRKQSTGY